jgi:hypothetical protein
VRISACQEADMGRAVGDGRKTGVDAERVMVPLDPDCGDHARTMITNYLKMLRCIV